MSSYITVQNSIINTYLEFFNTSPYKLLDILEVLVMQKSNPMVHQISFSSIVQSDNKTVQNYLVQLRSEAQDFNFICPNCHHDLSQIYIKDQFIRVIANDSLLVDMLMKAGLQKILGQNISHTKAFEMAMRDQNEISDVSDIVGLQMSANVNKGRPRMWPDWLLLTDMKGPWLKPDPGKMHVEVAVVTNMVELDQVVSHRRALHGARHAEHMASKTTLRGSASRRARRNKVLCDALRMRKPPWMPSLRT